MNKKAIKNYMEIQPGDVLIHYPIQIYLKN